MEASRKRSMRIELRWILLSGRLILAIGTAGLGVIELAGGDFIGRWEPVLASVPHQLAWLSGFVLIACGSGLIARQTVRASALALALFLLFWIAALHGPLVMAAPLDFRLWLYLGEVLAIACGALTLWAIPGNGGIATAARLGFGFSLLTFGASHFADLKLIASGVPGYVPAPMVVAGFTGGAHLAAGMALLSNVLTRFAAVVEAAMVSVFVLLVDVPEVISSPTHRGAWITLMAEGALVGAAWIVASRTEDGEV